MAWSEYDAPVGAGALVLNVQFKGGNAVSGPLAVQSSDNPTDEQYQAIVDALMGNTLVQSASITGTVPVSRTLTTDNTPPGDE